MTTPPKTSHSEIIRLSLLLPISLFFYACFGWQSLLCVLLMSGITWFGGLLITRSTHPTIPATIAILLLLAVWLTQKWNGIFLLGISFYSLQAIGYLLDIRNREYDAEHNPFRLLLFLSFFPLSIQGPIWRYSEFRQQLTHWQRCSHSDTSATASAAYSFTSGGIGRILWGAFKKLVLADRIARMTTILFTDFDTYRSLYVLLALTAYTIQLYLDFTGGIDMALGIAHCLGFRLPENFDRPFAARSLAEYWRRWHITLGSWFRDYVFYPLSLSDIWGGKITLAVWGSTLITWALTGLWHGLQPRFLLWGLLNGLILLMAQPLGRARTRMSGRQAVASRIHTSEQLAGGLAMIRIFLLTSLLRALDCYPDIRTAGGQVLSIFTMPPTFDIFRHGIPGLDTADLLLLAVCIGLFLLSRILRRILSNRVLTEIQNSQLLYCIGCGLLLLTTLLFGVYGSGYDASGFIYGSFI